MKLCFTWGVVLGLLMCACGSKQETVNLYDFDIQLQGGQVVSLDKYKGNVILIVNTASQCGFTPQYADLVDLYKKYVSKGFIILDFPCNQFGGQSPENDEETTQFCQKNYGTPFVQLREVEVNGEHSSPLFAWLKSQKKFEGFDMTHPLGALLDSLLKKENPDYASNSDIKWNFTKFLIDREGEVVARFEPTFDMKAVETYIVEELKDE